MLDLVGTILSLALTAVLVMTLAPARERHGARRSAFAVGIAAWFVAAALLGLAGAFASPALPPTVAVGIAVLAPLLFGAAAVARTQAFGIPLTTLVAVNMGRMVGAAFLLLHAQGRLPRTFAMSAGWGDIATGVLAIPVLWAIQRRVTGWRWMTAAWSALGMTDLLAAVTLAVGSTPGSPLHFIIEPPGTGTLAAFPWVLIPTFFVPLYLLIHIGVFSALAASARASASGSLSDEHRELPAA